MNRSDWARRRWRRHQGIIGMCTCIVAVAIAILLARATFAGDDEVGRLFDCGCGSTLMLCCPDHYCAKPLPCVPKPQMTCCPGSYCLKPLPCFTSPALTCCANNYCRKPMPRLCWPPVPAWHSCGQSPVQEVTIPVHQSGKK